MENSMNRNDYNNGRKAISMKDYVNDRTFDNITRNVNKLISANIKIDDFTAKDYKFTAGQIRQYKRLGFIKKTGEVFSDKLICINEEEGLFKKVKVGTYSMKVSNAEMVDYLKALKERRTNYKYTIIANEISALKAWIRLEGFTLENFNLTEIN